MKNSWSWYVGAVDTASEHMKLFHGKVGPKEGGKPVLVALVGPPKERKFAVQFLMDGDDERTRQILTDVRRELDFYLVGLAKRADSSPTLPAPLSDPWKYIIYHCGTSSNVVYSTVHWSYFPKGTS